MISPKLNVPAKMLHISDRAQSPIITHPQIKARLLEERSDLRVKPLYAIMPKPITVRAIPTRLPINPIIVPLRVMEKRANP